MGYKFYIQKATKSAGPDGDVIDIEKHFKGLHYLSCKGLETKGAIKNTYKESFPESNGVKSYHPSDSGKEVVHKETTIVLSLLFESGDHRAVYNDFYDFIKSSRLFYWDTARHKKVFLMLENETPPKDDVIKNTHYIRVDFTFTNLWGIGKKCDDSGNII